MQKIAVYGGAFDPPHIEHIRIIKAVFEELGVEKVVLLPSYNSPHKVLNEDFDKRVAMLQIIAKTFEQKVIIDTLESTISEKGYTVEMLPLLKENYGDFVFVIGGDSIINIRKWYQYEKLFEYDFAVVSRANDLQSVKSMIKELTQEFNTQISLLNYIGNNISSGVVRAKLELRMKEQLQGELTSEIYDYIISNDMYCAYKTIIDKALSCKSDELIAHIKRTVIKAMEYNVYLSLPYNKVFIASLLHDVAKGCEYDSRYEIPQDSINTAVMHQFLGAEMAKVDYHIKDNDVLNAIRYHTTSHIKADLLSKLIYVADMLEDGRDFEGVNMLREEIIKDFNKGYELCVIYTYNYLQEKQANIYPLTSDVYEKIKRGKND